MPPGRPRKWNSGARVALGLLLLAACSSVPKDPARIETHTLEDVLMGPELIEFCGGLVEVWAQVRAFGPSELRLKFSVPQGASWRVHNAHVVVENPARPNVPQRFQSFEQFEAPQKSTNVMRLKMDLESFDPTHGLKVAFRAFEGCASDQAIRGVILREHLGEP